jgi:hypothetical protein
MSLAIGCSFSPSLLRGVSKTEQLRALGGATFIKDYQATGTLTADYSVGSGTASYTANRDDGSVSTYVDASGVIQLQPAVDDTPRFQGGYYDATGFHAQRGLMVEAGETNRATYSGTPENAAWVKTNITADNDDAGSSSPDGVATSNRLLATAANGTFVQAYPITGAAATYTASCWLKRKTGTGTVNLGAVEDGTGKAAKTITTEWTRHSVTATTDGDDAGKDPAFFLELASDTDAVYIYGMQLEASPYMTSYIPCATAALTRNAEVLKYELAGNRTAATETIAIKFAPEANGSEVATGIASALSDTDTKRRLFYAIAASTDKSVIFPNFDNTSDRADAGVAIVKNTSYVLSASLNNADVNPNTVIYVNGSSALSTDSNINFNSPGWGTYFYVGSSNDGANQLNGIIQSVAIFSDAKDATAVAAITNVMNA